MLGIYKRLVLRRFQYDVFVGKLGQPRDLTFVVAMELTGIFGATLFAVIFLAKAIGIPEPMEMVSKIPLSRELKVISTTVLVGGTNYFLIKAVVGLNWIERKVAETSPDMIPEIKRKSVRDVMVPVGACVLAMFILLLSMP